QFEFVVATLTIARKCQWCESWMNGQEEMLDHVLGQHHERCFEKLVLKGEGVSRAIFVCLVSGCGQYYPESFLPGENPIDRLSRHSNQMHPKTMAYRKVDNPQDIRNLLGLREKWVWKCGLGSNCRPITPSAEDENAIRDKKNHLQQEHMNDLFAPNEPEKLDMDFIKLSAEIEGRYRRYLRTTFYLRDPDLRNSFDQALQAGTLSRGPYLEVTPAYRRGQELRTLFPKIVGRT